MAGNGAPSLSVSVSPATNRISPTNILYDGNGNVTQFGPSGSLTTLAYDVANRVQTVNSTNAYAYDPANQRAYFRNPAGTETLYLYGLNGKKLATYTIAGITGTQVNFTFQSRNVYFAGSLISAEGNAAAVDRLGSVRWSASTAGYTYFPYGVEYSATANNTEKYGTYTRDTLTGLDYAMNRYYASQWGRFLSPDPTHTPVVGPPTPSTYPVTSAPTGTLLTTYTYDQFNHLTQVSMPRTTGYGLVTQTRTFVYASTTYSTLTLPAVWLTSATNPESGTTSYTYNADGTLASKKDANGNTETYTYDAYQRLTGIPDRNQYFTYDTCPSGVTICANAPGQLMEAIFASGVGTNELSFTYGYAYTPAGKVASKSLMVQSANHLGGSVQASGTLTASYGYDGQGALVSQQYPISQTWASGTSNTFTYTLDALERPTQMTDSTQKTWASGATYNAANQPLYDGTATRTYNNLLQMTSIVASGLNMTYNYSATKNNGQITSSVDGISGETITYAYDALKRLSGASSSASWSAGYTFDGYGNLLGIAGSGGPPSISLTAAVNAKQRADEPDSGDGGHVRQQREPDGGIRGVDVQLRRGEPDDGGGRERKPKPIAYDSSNLRVYSRNASGAETIYFYGADGTKLATYTYSIITYSGSPEIQLTQQSANVYFLGKLISAEGNAVQVDRLGSVRSGGPGGLGHQAEYPYGVEYSADGERPGEVRDLHAGQRHGTGLCDEPVLRQPVGPLHVAGPDAAAALTPRAPQSWNRYPYVGG